ncbi:MAG TPA: ZIP family metal transporter [Gemmatimonadales bacterium]
MSTLSWILAGGLAMSLLALAGSLTLLLPAGMLDRLLRPMVAFAAGTLLGGAFLHMLPAAAGDMGVGVAAFLWVLAGFTAFFALEQFLHWHHCHRDPADGAQRPVTYLVLLGDGLHNLLGGFAVAGAFIADIRLGIGAWLAAAAHEIPQELGDFAVLVHGGWERRRALLFNLLSALTFLVGGLLAYAASLSIDVAFLLPFAAGNFIYIAASDLVPEVKQDRDWRVNLLHFAGLTSGIALLYLLRVLLER